MHDDGGARRGARTRGGAAGARGGALAACGGALAACGGALAAALVLAACGAPEPLTGCAPQGGLEPVCGFRNPEDLLELPGGEWLVVSQFPPDAEAMAGGSLEAFRPADGARRRLFPPAAGGTGAAPPAGDGAGSPTCAGPPDPARFGPHGIDLGEGGATLYVVNHGGREAVELFAVEADAEGPRLAWRGCVPLPEDAMSNDVAALPDGFAVTKMMPRRAGIGDLLRLARGSPTGEVLRWRGGEALEPVPGSESSAPNGIEAAADGEVLFVAEWGARRLLRMPLDGGAPDALDLPHRPDNLSWAPDGRLLVTGQTGPLLGILSCRDLAAGTCAVPFSVLAVDPQSLATELVLAHDPPRATGAGSVAVRGAGALWVGTFAGDRLLRVAP